MFLLRAAQAQAGDNSHLQNFHCWNHERTTVLLSFPQEISVKLEKHREARKFSNKLISSHSLKNIFDPYNQQ